MKRNLFSVFELLQTSVHLYRSHCSFFAGYVAWLLLPFGGIVLLNFIPLPTTILASGMVVFSFVQFFLSFWIGILLVRATGKILSFDTIEPKALQEDAWKLIKPIAVVSVLQLLIISGGLLLFFIPGFLFLGWFLFAQPAAILNHRRGLNALTYSRYLVRGRFFTALWKNLAGPFFIFISYSFVMAFLLYLYMTITGQDPASLVEGIPLWLETLDGVVQIFLLPFFLIYATLVYRDFQATL